mmetsp:Transcript_59715/g.118328  ORF Transcript_59715/g.118328 Transcript_59715/m.118328 type:complete len:617 (+) Transcript_59715:163-2013(+)
MLHLMPEIERMVDDNPRSPRQRRIQTGTTRSLFQRQLRDDVSGIIHDECQVLQQVLEEGLRRSEQAQLETLKQFLRDRTVPDVSPSNGTVTVFSARHAGVGESGQSHDVGRPSPSIPVDMRPLNKPCPSSMTDGSVESTDATLNVPSSPKQVPEARMTDGTMPPVTGGMFQERAARMAERGPGGNELAEASGWGKKKVQDDEREQQFEKGVDCCHFSRRETMLKLIKGKPFEMTCNFVIAANAGFMGWKANSQLDAAKEGKDYSSALATAFETFFTLFFAIEWLLRVIVYQKWFFKVEDKKWHIFDTILVLLSLVEIIIQMAAGAMKQTMLLRIFRVCRLVRLLKIARYLSFFRELRLMIFGLIASLRSLLWSFVMLGLVVYIFSIIFVQAAISFLQKDDFAGKPAEVRENFIEWFGSTQLGMRSLIVAISGGTDWYQFVQMMESVDWLYAFLFILYIMLVFHGVLHVIASIFVDSAMNTSKQEKDDLILQEMSNKDSYMTLIQTVLKEADKDGSGTISWDEFQRYLNDSRMTTFFKAIELDVTEARGLYKLLDVDESDEVPIDEFVTGCFRLKGNAKSLDLASLMHENKKVMRVLMKFMSYTEEQFGLLLQKCSQ